MFSGLALKNHSMPLFSSTTRSRTTLQWLNARALARTTPPLPFRRRRLPTPEHPPSALAYESSFPSINIVKALHHADFSAGDISKKEDVPTYTIAHDRRSRVPVEEEEYRGKGGKPKIDKGTINKMIKHIEGHYDRRT